MKEKKEPGSEIIYNQFEIWHIKVNDDIIFFSMIVICLFYTKKYKKMKQMRKKKIIQAHTNIHLKKKNEIIIICKVINTIIIITKL